MSDHERIWLEPDHIGGSVDGEGRLWCQDEVWTDGTEYVRADLFEALTNRLTAMEREVETAREAFGAIMDVGGEINPSNYNHDDVCALNGSYVEQFQIAEAALAALSPKDSQDTK